MSRIYHELLTCTHKPLAILQNYHFLLLECNDLFANACAKPPFSGCRLEELGFGDEVESILIRQYRIQESNDNVVPGKWEKISMEAGSAYAQSLFVRVFFVEPETGHFIIELDYPDLDMLLQFPETARQTLNNMPIPILLVDQTGVIRVTNHTGSMLCAVGQHDIIGKSIDTVLAPEIAKTLRSALERCYEKKVTFDTTISVPPEALPLAPNPAMQPLHLRIYANAARTGADQLTAVFVACEILP